MADYVVKAGVRVNVAGTIRSNGEKFSAEPEQVQAFLDAGWVTEAAGPASAPRRRGPIKVGDI